jgi:5-methylcytosine-specific restriction endonuclease McrA
MIDPYASRQYQANRKVVLEAAGFRCQWPGCRSRATTVDHIVPLARGGGHDLANLRASCARCNSQGGVKITNEIRRAKRVGRRSRRW